MKLKSMFLSLVLAVSATMAMAQPNGFTYQAVIRDAGGNLVKNQSVSLQVYLLTSDFSSWYYAEEQKATTNGYGQLSIVVGQGTPINQNLLFSNVNWNNDIYLQLKVDIHGGSDYVDMGYTKIQAVPYALYAANGGKGDKGDQGEKGDPGKSLTYRGYWYDEGEYHFNDYVLAPSSADPSISSMWIAQTDNVEVGTEPRNQTSGQWAEVVIPKGERGTGLNYRGYWQNNSVTYNTNDYVLAPSMTDPSLYSMWIAMDDNITSSNEPREETWNWSEIPLPKGDKGETGTSFVWRGNWYDDGMYNSGNLVLAPSSSDPTINSLWIAQGDNLDGYEPREETWNWAEIPIPKGEKGEQGKGLVYCGNWVNGGQYQYNDYVIAKSSYDETINSVWVAQNQINGSTSEPRYDLSNWVEIKLPQGPQGLKGDPGQPGTPGQQGPKGEAGIGFTYAGQWASVNAYSRGNYVFAQSTDDANVQSMWIAIADIAAGGAEPRNSANWVEFKAPKGEKGDSGEKGEAGTGLVNRGNWVQGAAYVEGNYVFAPSSTDASINSLWVAQSNFTSNSEPKSDGSHWIELKAPAGPQGEPGPQGADGMQVQGTRGQTLVHNGSTWVATDQFKVSENAMEISEKSGATDDEAIFVVKDKQGRPVFAVYPDGVCVYVDESNAKAKRSGLIVTGRPATKDDNATLQDYLVVNQNGTQVIVDQSEDKAPRSGLIVTGRPATKGGDQQDYLIVNPNGTQVIVDQSASDKAPRSGLIVTGRPATKGGDQQDYLIVNPNGTQVIVDQSATDKAPRSGLIVTGRPATKDGDAHDYLVVNPNGTQVIVDDELEGDAKAPRSGFIVTGRPATKDGEAANYMKVATDGTKISFDESNAKAKRSGLIITGRPATKDGVESDVLEVTPSATRIYVDGSSSKSGFGVDGKGTGSSSGFSVTEKGASNSAGYMNVTAQNFFAGYNAGKATTPSTSSMSALGKSNTFIGNSSGIINTTGYSNVFIGESAGYSNTEGNSNVNIGVQAGNNNRLGSQNVLIGDYAAKQSMKPDYSVVIGYKAGFGNMNYGYSESVFIGKESGYSNRKGNANVFIGTASGYNNLDGSSNISLGTKSGYNNTDGGQNIFMGYYAGYKNTVSHYNIFIGFQAGAHYGYTGTDKDKLRPGNTYVGMYAGAGGDFSETDTKVYDCMENSYFGKYSGFSTTTGSANTFIGSNSGRYVTTGVCNTIVGWKSGWNLKTGSYNVYLGCGSMSGAADESYKLRIGGYTSADIVAGTGSGNTTLIYGDIKEKYIVICGTNANGKKFYVNGLAGGSSAWNSTSDERLKKDVQTLEGALDKVLKLRGVSYYWKNQEEMAAAKGVAVDSLDYGYDDKKHIGVIAQELEKEFPELVSTADDGFKSVEYSTLAPILIEAMKEQQAIIDNQQKQIDELKKLVEELMKK